MTAWLCCVTAARVAPTQGEPPSQRRKIEIPLNFTLLVRSGFIARERIRAGESREDVLLEICNDLILRQEVREGLLETFPKFRYQFIKQEFSKYLKADHGLENSTKADFSRLLFKLYIWTLQQKCMGSIERIQSSLDTIREILDAESLQEKIQSVKHLHECVNIRDALKLGSTPGKELKRIRHLADHTYNGLGFYQYPEVRKLIRSESMRKLKRLHDTYIQIVIRKIQQIQSEMQHRAREIERPQPKVLTQKQQSKNRYWHAHHKEIYTYIGTYYNYQFPKEVDIDDLVRLVIWHIDHTPLDNPVNLINTFFEKNKLSNTQHFIQWYQRELPKMPRFY